MNTSRNDNDLVRIALIGTLLLGVAFAAALNFQRLPLISGGETYRAEFADASGLVSGEEVRVAGIKVGTVNSVELGHARVIVDFSVQGVELGEKTTAGIEVKTLLGQHFLSVTPDGAHPMAENSVIPLARTSTPVNVVPAFQRLTSQVQDLDTKQVAKAFDALSDGLDKTAPEMSETLRGLSRLSQSVESRDEDVRELFARTSDVSGVLAQRDHDIATLLADTNDVLKMLSRRRDTIADIITGTSALAHQLSGLVKDNRAQLQPALDKLNGVLGVLRTDRKQIDQILKVTAVYAREFTNVGGSGRWFDAGLTVPQGLALCPTGAGTGVPGLDGLLRSILSATSGGDKPCLPIGPAVEGTP